MTGDFISPLAGPLAALAPGPKGAVVVCDLTLSPRIGAKGAGVRDWLGLDLAANRACRMTSGGLAVMLADHEVLLASDIDQPAVDLPGYGAGGAIAPGVWPVPRDGGNFHLVLSGPAAPKVLARLSDVDFALPVFGSGAEEWRIPDENRPCLFRPGDTRSDGCGKLRCISG